MKPWIYRSGIWYIENMKKLILATLFACVFAHAEVTALQDPTPVESGEALQGFIGFSVSGAAVAESGAPFIAVRGGISLSNWLLGAWAGTIGSDVQNNDNGKQYLDYDAIGLFAEPTLYGNGKFALSTPLLAGLGFLNIRDQGEDEEFHSAGKFFIGDAGLLASWRISRNVRLAAGGGYRLTYGIETHGLSDGDFRSPYGEIQIVYGAF